MEGGGGLEEKLPGRVGPGLPLFLSLSTLPAIMIARWPLSEDDFLRLLSPSNGRRRRRRREGGWRRRRRSGSSEHGTAFPPPPTSERRKRKNPARALKKPKTPASPLPAAVPPLPIRPPLPPTPITKLDPVKHSRSDCGREKVYDTTH